MPRLLEVSLSTENIIKDMMLYADLGFEERPVNETIEHHYGVLGDEHLHVGLHQADFESPTLTYVLPDVARFAPGLGRVVEFEKAVLSDTRFNEVCFYDPDGQRINLIEARTFSPAFNEDTCQHRLGTFSHLELPMSDQRVGFWTLLREVLVTETTHLDSGGPMSVQFSESVDLLTAVYRGDVDALIMHSAQQGWQHLSVNEHHQGMIRTPHHFQIRVEPETSV